MADNTMSWWRSPNVCEEAMRPPPPWKLAGPPARRSRCRRQFGPDEVMFMAVTGTRQAARTADYGAAIGPACSHQYVGTWRAATDHARFSGVDRSGRPDVLRSKLSGLVPACRRVGRQDFAREISRWSSQFWCAGSETPHPSADHRVGPSPQSPELGPRVFGGAQSQQHGSPCPVPDLA
jgi:hypothetical protein